MADLSEFLRNRCAACYKEFNKKEHLVLHMRTSYHSAHEPQCPVCNKHCKSFDSVREHLAGQLPKEKCSKMFRTRGCNICLAILDSTNALLIHQTRCGFSRVKPKLLFRTSNLSLLDKLPLRKGGRSRLRVIALACKMVMGGHNGMLDLCARMCLIDEDENIILHTYVKPPLPITNYRFGKTGILPEYLKETIPLKMLQRELQYYLCSWETMGKIILVGHGLDNDLESLGLVYPAHMIRDTAKYPPLLGSYRSPNTLKYLTRAYLGYDVHTGVEDPYEDCVASMRLYKRMRMQVHGAQEYPLASNVGNSNNFAVRRQKELEKMTPKALLEISGTNYYCWCLDSRK